MLWSSGIKYGQFFPCFFCSKKNLAILMHSEIGGQKFRQFDSENTFQFPASAQKNDLIA
jgi:hypothetical protein